MSQRISININQIQKQKQMQHLMMSPQMQQALNLLQMPILELSHVVEMELMQNPMFELIEERGEELYDEGEAKDLEFHEGDFERLLNLDGSIGTISPKVKGDTPRDRKRRRG